jgi:hypothetical protein
VLPLDRADGSQLGQQPVNRWAGQLAQLARPVDLWKRPQQPEGAIQHSSPCAEPKWCRETSAGGLRIIHAGHVRSVHRVCPFQLPLTQGVRRADTGATRTRSRG